MDIPAKNTIPDDLLSDILEQPEVWRKTLGHFFLNPPPSQEHLKHYEWVGLGEGSSYWAFKMAMPFLTAWCPFSINVHTPESLGTLLNQMETWETTPLWIPGKCFIPVSQSGETASVLNILQRLQTLHQQHSPAETKTSALPVLPVVNTIPSTLSKTGASALGVIPILAEKERYIAATKSTSTTLLTLILQGFLLARRECWLSTDQAEATLSTLNLLPDVVERFLNDEHQRTDILNFAQHLKEEDHFILLSKGILSTVLPEAGLKLMETSCNLVYTDNTEGFKHGPKVLLQGTQHGHIPNTLYIIPPEAHLAAEVFADKEKHFKPSDNHPGFDTRRTFYIRFDNSPPCPAEANPQHCLTLPASHSSLMTVFLGLVTFQLISFFIAWLRGQSPDNAALSKAVVD